MRRKFNSNETGLVRTGSKQCGVLLISDEVKLLRRANLGFPIGERNKRIFAKKEKLRTAIWCGYAAVSRWKPILAFENPNGFKIRLQLATRLDEGQLHLRTRRSVLIK